jgi:hypothetical protein
VRDVAGEDHQVLTWRLANRNSPAKEDLREASV